MTKIAPRAPQEYIQEGGTTFEVLQASLVTVKVSVNDSAIRARNIGSMESTSPMLADQKETQMTHLNESN